MRLIVFDIVAVIARSLKSRPPHRDGYRAYLWLVKSFVKPSVQPSAARFATSGTSFALILSALGMTPVKSSPVTRLLGQQATRL